MVPIQENFDIPKYMGKWYEIYRTKAIPFEKGSNIEANYSLNSDLTIEVINKEYFEATKSWNSISGIARIVDPLEPARLSVKFKWWMPSGDYRVLYTDYDNISIVYSEFSIFGWFKQKYAWILARDRGIAEEMIADAFKMIEEKTGLEKDAFLKTPVVD